MSSKNPALVFGRQITTLPLIRSLGKRKVPVYQFHHRERDFSTYSKYSNFIKCWNPLYHEKELLNQLILFGKRLKKRGVIFPISDEFILFVSKNSTELGKYFYFYKQSFDIERILDKRKFIQVCQNSGLPHPKSLFSEDSEDVYNFFWRLNNPIIAKRANHYIKVGDKKFWKALKLSNREELDEFISRYNTENFIFQDYIPGENKHLISYLPLVDRKNRIKMELVGRKIAQFPSEFGSATLVEKIEDEEAMKLGRSWVEYLGLRGPSQVEFIKDKRDNKLKLLEINPRFIYWSSFMKNNHDDVFNMAYRDLLGQELKPVLLPNHFNYWIYFIRYLESNILNKKNLLLLFKKGKRMADIDFSDIKPLAFHVVSDAKKIFFGS